MTVSGLALFWHPARASCAAAKEFLGEHGVSFESVDVRDGADGTRRWLEVGRPIVPSLVVDGEPLPILHVSQLAVALGLPAPVSAPVARLAADTADLLRAWLDQVRSLPWRLLVAPTPSRGRSIRNLTVNVFHPFELLPGAWAGHDFDWRPEEDDRRERRLRSARAVVAYAERVHAAWSTFLDGPRTLDRPDLVVTSPRGELTWVDLLDHQRWHAAFHYRQLVAFLDEQGVVRPPALPLGLLDGLELPDEVF